jgi:hypothetical protein
MDSWTMNKVKNSPCGTRAIIQRFQRGLCYDTRMTDPESSGEKILLVVI